MKRGVSLISILMLAILFSVNCAETPTTPSVSVPNPPGAAPAVAIAGQNKFRVGVAGHFRIEVYQATPSSVTLDFGDGTTLDLGATNSADVMHAYTNTGSFILTATVTVASGVSHAQMNITVV